MTCVAFPQTKSPNAYRAAARVLTVGDLSGVAESAGQGDAESQLLLGLSSQLVSERIEYDVEGRTGMLRSSAHWFRQGAEKKFAPSQYFLAETDLRLLENCDEIAPQNSVLKMLDRKHATSRNLLFATNETAALQAAFDPTWESAVPYTVLIDIDGKVLCKNLGTIDILELRRTILANLPSDYIGFNEYWRAGAAQKPAAKSGDR